MINFLNSIVDTITSLISFVVHAIQSLFSLLINIPRYVTYLSNVLQYIPSVFAPFLLVSISLYVMYLIVGRSVND